MHTHVDTAQNKELLRRYYEEVVSTGAVDDVPRFVSPAQVDVDCQESSGGSGTP
jgi:hypothetical protein